MDLRTGIGYDVHQLEEGLPLVIGGVRVPFDKGVKGHSDADVLVHAIMDALLGAAAMGDIGKHFPDTDPDFKGSDSLVLLRHIVRMLEKNGWKILNTDSTVCLERPKLRPYIEQMRSKLASVLQIAVDRISIKATTTEKMGFIGHGKGISALATALISRD